MSKQNAIYLPSYFAFLVFIFISISCPAQHTEKVRITLNSKGLKVGQILDSITLKTGFKFALNPTQIDLERKVDVHWKNINLNKALQSIFEQQNFKIHTLGDNILINPKNTLGKVTFNVNGIISDEKGPLQNVLIKVQGSKQYVLSDSIGSYVLNSLLPNTKLEIIHNGFVTKRLVILQSGKINISLEYAIDNLSEVVVIGYATQQKKEINGAISSIKGKYINSTPSASFETALQGRSAGVQIVNNSGNPAGETYVRIRGNASLLGSNQPLYVLDGVPILAEMNRDYASTFWAGGQQSSPLSDLNPADIEKIDILKDASASSIYGSRGSNGVILITTKRGIGDGKLKIRFDSYVGVQQNIRKLPVMNAGDFSNYAQWAYNKSGNSGNAPIVNTGVDTDWQKQVFRKAGIYNLNLSISKEDSLSSLYFSLGKFQQEGILIGSDYNKYSARLNYDRQLSKKFKMGISTWGNIAKSNRVVEGLSQIGVLATALLKNPNLPVYNSNGTYYDDPSGLENPVRVANDVALTNKQNRLVTGIFGEYSLHKNLLLRNSFSLDFVHLDEKLYIPYTLQNYRLEDRSNNVVGRELLWINETTLSYKKWYGDHHFTTQVGIGYQYSDYKNVTSYSSVRSDNGQKNLELDTNIVFWNIRSAFARINYWYRQKYFVTLIGRTDGSSRLGNNIRFGVFPSVAVGWRLSQENFLKNSAWINELKIRASIGFTGNQDQRSYSDKGLIFTNNLPADKLAIVPDANLSWEKTRHINLGIDFGFLNRRLFCSFDTYLKSSDNLLMWKNFYIDSTYVIGIRNMAGMENKGLEITLSSENLRGRIIWNTAFNISFLYNSITYMDVVGNKNDRKSRDYIEDVKSFVTPNNPEALNIYRANEAFGSYYGYHFLGVDQSNGRPIYEDLNKDNIINEEDRKVIGNPLPKFFGGLTNIFKFKSLEFETLLQWTFGNQIYNLTRATMNNGTHANRYNATQELNGRWQNSNTNSQIPAPYLGSNGAMNLLPSSRWVEDGSYLRVKNVSISYKFQQKIFRNSPPFNAKIYITGQNLFTLTQYSGMDPESQNQATRNSTLGVDVFVYPSAKSYRLGINLEF